MSKHLSDPHPLAGSIERWRKQQAYEQAECDSWPEIEEYLRITSIPQVMDNPPVQRSLTLLRSQIPNAKTFDSAGKKHNPKRPKWYEWSQYNFSSLIERKRILERESKKGNVVLISEEVRKGSDRWIQRLGPDKPESSLLQKELWELTLDIEKFRLEKPFDPSNPDLEQTRVIGEVINALPPELHGVTCEYHFSNSCFLSPVNKHYRKDYHNLRVHLSFLLSQPVAKESLKDKFDCYPFVDKSIFDNAHTLTLSDPTFENPRLDPFLWTDPLGKEKRISRRGISFDVKQEAVLDGVLTQADLDAKKKAEEAEREREKERLISEFAKRKNLRPLVTRESKRGAEQARKKANQTALDNAFHEIIYAANGAGHVAILKVSNRLGGFISGNGLDEYEAIDTLEKAVIARYSNQPQKLSKGKATVKEGLANGQKYPVSIDFKTKQVEEILAKLPNKYDYTTLEELRRELPHKIYKALLRSGKTLFKVPAGSGKTYAAMLACIEYIKQNPNVRILFALPTNANKKEKKKEFEKLLRKSGVDFHVALFAATVKEGCSRWEVRQQAAMMKEGGGGSFCHNCDVRNQLGYCKQLKRNVCTIGHIAFVTHDFAPVVIDIAEENKLPPYDVLIWDESLNTKGVELANEGLAKFSEIENTGPLEKLLQDSIKRDGHRPTYYNNYKKRLNSALKQLTISIDDRGRQKALYQLLGEHEVKLAEYPDYKILKAISKAQGMGVFDGFYLYDGSLKYTYLPDFPSVERTIILDATAQPYLSKVMYGEHVWEEITVKQSSFAYHLHINVNAGSSAASVNPETGKLTWETDIGEQIWEIIKKLFPDLREATFKKWQIESQLGFYINGVKARGSNDLKDSEQILVTDFYVPCAFKDAMAQLILSKLDEPVPIETIKQEIEAQYEIAPMIQIGSRIRPYSATEQAPKFIVTLGSKNRLRGQFAPLENSIEVNPSEVKLWGGELDHNMAPYALQAIADKQSGLLKKDLEVMDSVELSSHEIAGREIGYEPLQKVIDRKHDYSTTHIKNEWQEGAVRDPETEEVISIEIYCPEKKQAFIPSRNEDIEAQLIALAERKSWEWLEVKIDGRKKGYDFILSYLPKDTTKKEAVATLISNGVKQKTAYRRVKRLKNLIIVNVTDTCLIRRAAKQDSLEGKRGLLKATSGSIDNNTKKQALTSFPSTSESHIASATSQSETKGGRTSGDFTSNVARTTQIKRTELPDPAKRESENRGSPAHCSNFGKDSFGVSKSKGSSQENRGNNHQVFLPLIDSEDLALWNSRDISQEVLEILELKGDLTSIRINLAT